MINYNQIPTEYSEDSIQILDQIPTLTIQSSEDVDITTVAMRNLKKFIKDAEAKKKEAIKPHEDRRKLADAELREARTAKKEAGEPFEDPISKAKDLESKMRDSINEYTNEQIRKAAELEAAQIAAAQEAATEGSAAVALAPPTPPPMDISNNISYQTKLTFEVEDFMVVPENYLNWVADENAISEYLAKNLPGISFHGSFTLTAINDISSQYTKAVLNEAAVMEDLKKLPDLVIPGIKRLYEERAVVR